MKLINIIRKGLTFVVWIRGSSVLDMGGVSPTLRHLQSQDPQPGEDGNPFSQVPISLSPPRLAGVPGQRTVRPLQEASELSPEAAFRL